MERHEFIAIVFSIFGVALFIASCVLSIAFLMMDRQNRWRWLPCISVIALPLIEIVPESGWSDVRSQWHQTALGVVWSVWALYLALILLRSGKGRISLRQAPYRWLRVGDSCTVYDAGKRPNKGVAANRRYTGQLDDFMKFDCQDCIWESRSAAVAELKR